jgi:methionine sulfoxide reductase heme-binding subunit
MPHSRVSNYFPAVCAALALAIIVSASLIFPESGRAWQHASRWTADLSAIIFLSLFVPAAKRCWGIITMHSRAWAFLTVHLIHAGAFITYHLLTHGPAVRTIILGGAGYVFVATLPFISPTDRPRLHRFGQWYLWFIFTATFAAGFKNPDRLLTSSIGVGLMLLAAGYRLRPHFRLG